MRILITGQHGQVSRELQQRIGAVGELVERLLEEDDLRLLGKANGGVHENQK